MGKFIGTSFRATYYNGPRTRFTYFLATTQQEAERIAAVYCNPGEVVFRVRPEEV